ncbi:MAG: methyltransferase domain-containing protein [Calditrichia bacterium]
MKVSLDLGRSDEYVRRISRDSLLIDSSRDILRLNLEEEPDERTIFIGDGKSWKKWQLFDETTGFFYKMVNVASGKPPTIEISGVKMHVTQDGDPQKDTRQKLKQLKKIRGRVWDTCLGLGYTAIALSQLEAVEDVFVSERDLNVLKLCRQNPWSRELFESSKIHLVLSPAQEMVRNFSDDSLDAVLHDPPRFSRAGELYGEFFYRELFRVLKPGGQLYHYTGDPNRYVRKRGLPQQVQQRLLKIGFYPVLEGYFGVTARKPKY